MPAYCKSLIATTALQKQRYNSSSQLGNEMQLIIYVSADHHCDDIIFCGSVLVSVEQNHIFVATTAAY